MKRGERLGRAAETRHGPRLTEQGVKAVAKAKRADRYDNGCGDAATLRDTMPWQAFFRRAFH